MYVWCQALPLRLPGLRVVGPWASKGPKDAAQARARRALGPAAPHCPTERGPLWARARRLGTDECAGCAKTGWGRMDGGAGSDEKRNDEFGEGAGFAVWPPRTFFFAREGIHQS